MAMGIGAPAAGLVRFPLASKVSVWGTPGGTSTLTGVPVPLVRSADGMVTS